MDDFNIECVHCQHVFSFKARQEDLNAWESGKLIQDALPYLSASERELLISGTCDNCWQIMFVDDAYNEDDDDDDDDDDYDEDDDDDDYDEDEEE